MALSANASHPLPEAPRTSPQAPAGGGGAQFQVVATPVLGAPLKAPNGTGYSAEALSSDCTIRGWFLPPDGAGIRGLRLRRGKALIVARRKQLRPEVLLQHPDRTDALYSGFSVEVKLRRGWNRFIVEFKDGARKWHPSGEVRLFLSPLWRIKRRFLRPVAQENYYTEWIRSRDELSPARLQSYRDQIEQWARRPLISVLVPVFNTPERWLRRCIESIEQQIYPHWELCVADDASTAPHVAAILREASKRDRRIKVTWRKENGHISAASNSALEICNGAFTALLDHDDELPPDALFHAAWEMIQHPDAGLIFSDEDKIDEHGHRSDPYFKSGWNYDRLLQENSVSHLGLFQTSLLREAGGFREGFEGSQDWDVTLRVVERLEASQIRHIPRVLYHWRTLPTSTSHNMASKPYAEVAGRRAVEEHLARTQPGAVVTDAGGKWRIVWPLPDPAPLVSIIIPTRDRLDLLRPAVESLFERTEYPLFEVLVIDHESSQHETLQWLREMEARRANFRVAPAEGEFNWSRLNNLGARLTTGEILLFLNNDVEITQAGWLRELAAQAWRRDVGAAGACLLYPNGTLQHAGVVLGLRCLAGHAFRGWRLEAPTHAGTINLAREVTAVTGACMAVRREVFEAAGGFDQERLPVNWNDIDFCLRLRRMGLRNIWTPHAVLTHQESASRAAMEETEERKTKAAAEAACFLERWADLVAADPFFNANFSRECEIPLLAMPEQSR